MYQFKEVCGVLKSPKSHALLKLTSASLTTVNRDDFYTTLAWRRWWYRFPDVATLALPVSRDAYFVFSLLFVSEDEEGSWMKMSEQRIKGRIRGRYKWIFVARVCSPRRSSYVRSSVNGECC